MAKPTRVDEMSRSEIDALVVATLKRTDVKRIYHVDYFSSRHSEQVALSLCYVSRRLRTTS